LAKESIKGKKVNTFFAKKIFVSVKSLYINDGTWAYYIFKHNQDFALMDCTSSLVRKMYESKFTCDATKCQAIIVSVLFPYAFSLVKK